MLELLVKSVIDSGKILFKAVCDVFNIKQCFDIEEFFKIIEFKNKQEFYPKTIKIYDSPKGYTYLLSCPIGLSLADFEKLQGALEIQIKSRVEIRERNGYIEVEVITAELLEKIKYELPKKEKDSIYIPFAQSVDNTVQYLDLKEVPHVLATGTTGSGKSITTRNILTSLISLYPENVNLWLIDFKIVELSIFKNLKQTKCYVNEVEDAKEVIADLLAECKRRYKLFEEVGVTNIYDYNKKVAPNKRLKYDFIVVEEFVMLLEDKKKHAMTNLKKLASLSRASGQFLYITAQRFDNTIIDLVLRSLIGNRLCHRVESENDSKLIIDSLGAEKLRGNGHMIFKCGSQKTECQGYYITDYQIREHTKRYVKKSENKTVGKPQSNFKPINDTKINKQNEVAENGNLSLDWIDKI